MNPPFAPYLEQVYAITRFVVGLLFAVHGAQKLFGVIGGQVQPLASMMGTAGIIELACGLLVMVGLFSGIAAFIASGEMAVAYFMVHAPQAFWPVQNQGEPAVLFCFAFLFIAAKGSGIWSLDEVIAAPRRTLA